MVTDSAEERTRLLEVLRKILQAIGSVHDEWEIFEVAVRESVRQFRYAWVSLVLEDLDEKTARVFLSVPTGRAALHIGEVVAPESGFRAAMQSGCPFVRRSLEEGGPLWEDAALRGLAIRAYVCIPIAVRGKVIGTYNVGTRDAAGLGDSLGWMALLAEFLGNAVLAARLLREVQEGLARLREKAARLPLMSP